MAKTLSFDATHYNKEDALYVSSKNTIYEFDFHNIDGFIEGFRF